MRINYTGGTKMTAETRGHKVMVDLPPEKGGKDTGMTPPELLVAAFGTCIGIYVTQACHQLGVDPEGTSVDITWETAPNPLRVGRMHAKVMIPKGVPEDKMDKVKHTAENCLIHQTLCNMPDMEIKLEG